jgi:MbtH protein
MTNSQRAESSGPKTFKVVVNHEEQYSIWPADKAIPEKWSATGIAGSKEECLDYVRRVWSDMRPLSVRITR